MFSKLSSASSSFIKMTRGRGGGESKKNPISVALARHTSLVFVTLSPQGPLNPVEFAFPFKSRGTTKGSRRRGKSEGGKEGARCQRKNQIIVRIKRRSRNDVSPPPPPAPLSSILFFPPLPSCSFLYASIAATAAAAMWDLKRNDRLYANGVSVIRNGTISEREREKGWCARLRLRGRRGSSKFLFSRTTSGGGGGGMGLPNFKTQV